MSNKEYFTGFLCAAVFAPIFAGSLALLLYFAANGASWPRLFLFLKPFLSFLLLTGKSVIHFVYKIVLFLLFYAVCLAGLLLAGGGAVLLQYYQELVQTMDLSGLLKEVMRYLFSGSYFLQPFYSAVIETDVQVLLRMLCDLLLFSAVSAAAAVLNIVYGLHAPKRAVARYRRRLKTKQ